MWPTVHQSQGLAQVQHWKAGQWLGLPHPIGPSYAEGGGLAAPTGAEGEASQAVKMGLESEIEVAVHFSQQRVQDPLVLHMAGVQVPSDLKTVVANSPSALRTAGAEHPGGQA